MELVATAIAGLVELRPKTFDDNRGWFQEFYKHSSFEELSGGTHFVQDNISYSKQGVIRGLHLQAFPAGQAKLVTVIQGRVLDVVVDLRAGSDTFGKVFTLELSAQQKNMLFIPEGFAHGFSALEDSIFFYKCSREYAPKTETGIVWNDPSLAINWKVSQPIISEKDQKLPFFHDLLKNSVISR